MASTAKSKLIPSTKRRKSLNERRCRRRHRKYIESLELSKSSTPSDKTFYPPLSWYPPMSGESSEDSERWEPPELPSPPEWMTIPVPEEPDLSPDAPMPLRYGNVRCKRCRQLAELKLQSKPDDDEYVYRNDDFFGDEELRLRVIHYRRTMWQNGCFDVDCFPNYPSFGAVYHRDHYYVFPNFDKLLWKSLKFAINTYCEKEKKELVLLGILNATAEVIGQWILFYLTFECYSPNAEDKYYVDILQTMVTCPLAHKEKQEVLIFRRVTNDERADEDLLPPDEFYEECTRGKTPRRFDTLRAKYPTTLLLDI
ncbi:hypothetical protein LINPERHAP2_LOCUS32277 [Linum perenne]